MVWTCFFLSFRFVKFSMPNAPDFETLFSQVQLFISTCNGEHIRYATDTCKSNSQSLKLFMQTEPVDVPLLRTVCLRFSLCLSNLSFHFGVEPWKKKNKKTMYITVIRYCGVCKRHATLTTFTPFLHLQVLRHNKLSQTLWPYQSECSPRATGGRADPQRCQGTVSAQL